MSTEPLKPGVYICRFDETMHWTEIRDVLAELNRKSEPCGVHFIPERTDVFQILTQEQED